MSDSFNKQPMDAGERISVGTDTEILEERIRRKSYEDYFCMFFVDLDALSVKVIKDSPFFSVGGAGTVLPYAASMQKFAASFRGAPREFFTRMSDADFVREAFAAEDKQSYSYKSTNVEAGKWVNVTGYALSRHTDGTVATFCLGFSLMDTMGSDR